MQTPDIAKYQGFCLYIGIDSDIWAKIGISEVFAKGKQVRKYDVFCSKCPYWV